MRIDNNPLEVVIIGGGLAGLSAAIHLAERGIHPLVLEADPHHIGGRVAGGEILEIDGWNFRMEHGVHGIWSPYRNLQAMLARNKIRPVFVPADEETWIFKNNNRINRAPVGSAIRSSWLPAPFHYLALFFRPRFLAMLDILDWLTLPFVWYGLLFGLGIDPLREDQPMEGMWLTDITKHWAPAVRAFITGLARNGLAARPNEVQLAGFIAFLRFYTLLRRDTWAFSYLPSDGGTSLAEPLAKRILELGGTINLGTRVRNLDYIEDCWKVTIDSSQSGLPNHILAKQVILAVDSPSAAEILQASPSTAELSKGLYWPKGMETAVVRVWFTQKPKPGAEAGIFSGDFILHNFFWLDRLQEQYIRWSNHSGGSAIEVHIYGPPEVLAQSDAMLLARAVKDIQNAFPELREHRIHQIIQRNLATHTLFSIGYKEKHLGTVTPWKNLFCCGDWIHHSSPAFFLERACVTGIHAANEVMKNYQYEPWKLLAYPEPEPLARAIEKLFRIGRQSKRNKRLKSIQE